MPVTCTPAGVPRGCLTVVCDFLALVSPLASVIFLWVLAFCPLVFSRMAHCTGLLPPALLQLLRPRRGWALSLLQAALLLFSLPRLGEPIQTEHRLTSPTRALTGAGQIHPAC